MSTDKLKALIDTTMRYGTNIDSIPPDKAYQLLKLSYAVLGLAGEAGELANKVKKIIRDKGGVISEEDREELAFEAGDVMWYLGAVSKEIDYDIDTIIDMNHGKLMSRMERGKLGGSGDNR